MNFQATVTHPRTGETTAYTQDTLGEYAAQCVAEGLCTKAEAKMGKTPAPRLINARNGRWVAADHEQAIDYNQVWNPQAAAADVGCIATNSFAPVRLTKDEKEWLGMTVETRFGRGEVFSLGPSTGMVWVLLHEPNPSAARYHIFSTDRMVCLYFDQCQKIASWQKRAESLF